MNLFQVDVRIFVATVYRLRGEQHISLPYCKTALYLANLLSPRVLDKCNFIIILCDISEFLYTDCIFNIHV